MNWARRRTGTNAVMAVFLGVSLGLSCGCGGGAGYDGPQRAAVSGSVIVDGSDLAYGQVRFVPVDEKLRYTNATIFAGKYTIPEAQGPNLGAYKVEILGYAKPPAEPDPDTGGAADGEDEDEGSADNEYEETGENQDGEQINDTGEKQILPARYNTATILEATIESGTSDYSFVDLTVK